MQIEMKDKKIIVDGIEYVEASTVDSAPAESLDGMPYVIIRGYRAGCHAGYLKSKKVEGAMSVVTLIKGRRLWYWDGAATLSQIAEEGFSKPDKCKFPCEVSEYEVYDVSEILKTTEKAKSCIQGIKIWSA